MNTEHYDPAEYSDRFSDAAFYYFVEEAIPVTADTRLAPRASRPERKNGGSSEPKSEPDAVSEGGKNLNGSVTS